MYRLFIYIFLSAFSIEMFSQEVKLDSVFEPKLSGEIFHMQTGMHGSQFFNEEWAIGNVVILSGEVVNNKKLKYNSLTDQLIWLLNNSFRQIQLEKNFIKEFTIHDNTGKSRHFKKLPLRLPQFADSSGIFAEVLKEGSASLYVARSVIKEGHDTEVKNGILYSYDVLKSQPVYFLQLPDRKFCSFRRIRRGALLRALNEKDKAIIKEIIQKNHLSIRTEEDLVALTSLIN